MNQEQNVNFSYVTSIQFVFGWSFSCPVWQHKIHRTATVLLSLIHTIHFIHTSTMPISIKFLWTSLLANHATLRHSKWGKLHPGYTSGDLLSFLWWDVQLYFRNPELEVWTRQAPCHDRRWYNKNSNWNNHRHYTKDKICGTSQKIEVFSC
jgi:hypothetical protein